MEISYLGLSSFRIKVKDLAIVTDPYKPEAVGFKFPKVQGEVVSVSHQHDGHNNSGAVVGVRKVVDAPGEYEIGGVSIIGLATFHDNEKGSVRGKNTIYIIEAEELRVVHLGDLGHKLNEELIEDVGDVDILMIPVGGEYTIGASDACSIVQDIEPRIVIPMHYQLPDLNPQRYLGISSVELFLSEVGLPVEKTQKYQIKKDMLVEEGKVILLERK